MEVSREDLVELLADAFDAGMNHGSRSEAAANGVRQSHYSMTYSDAWRDFLDNYAVSISRIAPIPVVIRCPYPECTVDHYGA